MEKKGIKNRFKSSPEEKRETRRQREAAYQDSINNMLERAKQLKEQGLNAYQITEIVAEEGLWNSKKKEPFTVKMVRYWITRRLKPSQITPEHIEERQVNREILRELYTKSLKDLRFTDEEIEKELKVLLDS